MLIEDERVASIEFSPDGRFYHRRYHDRGSGGNSPRFEIGPRNQPWEGIVIAAILAAFSFGGLHTSKTWVFRLLTVRLGRVGRALGQKVR